MEKLGCVLLIDDDNISNYLNQKLFATIDIAHKVEIVEDGENALNFLNEFHKKNGCLPELILIDVNIPVMNGYEIALQIKQLYHRYLDTVKVVMLTAALRKSDEALMMETNFAVSSLEKPLTGEKIEMILST